MNTNDVLIKIQNDLPIDTVAAIFACTVYRLGKEGRDAFEAFKAALETVDEDTMTEASAWLADLAGE